ncbi:MAG: head GIN domain-containing protein [Saprospiraceae bacterium]
MKKATILNLIVTLLISSSIFATDIEVRELGNFSRVAVATGINLILVPGNTNEAEIEVDNIDLEDIITKVEGRKLIIKVKGKNWGWKLGKRTRRKVNVTLTYKDINEISASSGARVTSDYALVNEEIEVSASSGSSVNLEIEGNDVEASASSGATITLSGECNTLDASVSSGSRIKGSDLEASDVEASASSGASMRIWAKESLYARASSGGTVKYKGNPEKMRKKKSSGGSVKQI